MGASVSFERTLKREHSIRQEKCANPLKSLPSFVFNTTAYKPTLALEKLLGPRVIRNVFVDVEARGILDRFVPKGIDPNDHLCAEDLLITIAARAKVKVVYCKDEEMEQRVFFFASKRNIRELDKISESAPGTSGKNRKPIILYAYYSDHSKTYTKHIKDYNRFNRECLPDYQKALKDSNLEHAPDEFELMVIDSWLKDREIPPTRGMRSALWRLDKSELWARPHEPSTAETVYYSGRLSIGNAS